MEIAKITGWSGAFLIILAFFTVSYNFLTVESVTYQLMNLIGASALFYTAFKRKSPSIATLQIIWALISLGALIKIIY
jgi:hypothetical protein